jgi:hypothetical protein
MGNYDHDIHASQSRVGVYLTEEAKLVRAYLERARYLWRNSLALGGAAEFLFLVVHVMLGNKIDVLAPRCFPSVDVWAICRWQEFVLEIGLFGCSGL